MGITYSDPDVAADEHLVQIAALTPTDNGVIIGNGTAWTVESGSTLRTSLGLAIGSDVQAYDADLAQWAGVNPSSYLTTAAAALAYQPLDSDLTSWASVTRASGFDTFAATPTSANLRALLTDESGSGALLFAGGALGTPASGVLTNCTGLPNASVVGLGTAALVADSGLVHIAGTETITGAKTFAADVRFGTAPGPQFNSPFIGFYNAVGTRKAYVQASAGGVLQISAESDTVGINFGANGGTVQVAGDPVMTRGATETVTGDKTFTGAAGTTFRRSGQPIALDNTGGGYLITLLSASSVTGYLYSDATNFELRTSGLVSRMTMAWASGNVTFTGTVNGVSDATLKNITGRFERGLADMLKMDGPKSFTWKNREGEEATREYHGWIAQDVQIGIPEAVHVVEGKLAVEDRPIIAAMFNAIKELSARIAVLEAAQ